MFFNIGKEGRNDWWLYILGIILVLLGYALGQIPLTIVLMSAMSKDPDLDMSALEEFQSNPDFSIFGIDLNFGFFLLLMMFVVATLALYLVVKYLHKKSWKSILTSRSKLDWSRVFFGFALWFGMTLILEGVNYFISPEAYEYTFNLKAFLPLLAIALILLPIQTSFEEFFFRGYLMQGIGNAASHKWIPLIITSIFFGLIHSMNPEVQEFGFFTMQFYYIGAGLLLGLLVVMDDGMELSLGVHAATNMYGALMVGYNGAAIQTETIMKTTDINPQIMTVVFLVSAVIFYSICARKYKWKPISKIFDQIDNNSPEDYA